MKRKKKNYPSSDSGPPELVALFKKLREIRTVVEYDDDSSSESATLDPDW